ncbi:hypothetical protein LCGC14_0394980 [marine sediment metagenome]|uniref:Uncharacterized protein n=1 Tax=marine sediment metagenome TaxID=412755 RepID=A0A0F9W7C6_9ZZZZ
MKVFIIFKVYVCMFLFVLMLFPFTVLHILCDGFEGIGGDFRDLWEDKYFIFGNPDDWKILDI